jgi:hypothetical protein
METFYSYEGVEEAFEQDGLSAMEECFMQGYLSA